MKNITKILNLILLSAFLVISANAQITSISQIKDVKPTDKHYQALQSLIEKYGVFMPYPDNTFRANDPLTREEFVILLDKGLDRLMETAYSQDETISAYQFFESFSANNANISSTSQIKDIKENYAHFTELQSLIERYGIIICDFDKNFRPNKSVTEKEFYTWIATIFRASINSDTSATKIISRSEFVIVMNAAFDSVNEKITPKSVKKRVVHKSDLIKELPSSGKAQIVNYLKSYPPDNTCTDLANASIELKMAVKKGGILGDYKIKTSDVGDIILETNNTCIKGEKIILLRIGTAIVTMQEKGIKRLK